MQSEANKKQTDLELSRDDHFAFIKQKIDTAQNELKAKIDELAKKMIEEVNEKENAYKLKIRLPFPQTNDKELQKSSQAFMDEFRKPNLVLEDVKRLVVEQELRVKQLKDKLADFHKLNTEIESVEFRLSKAFQEESFGVIQLSKPLSKLVSCSKDKKIKIWDADTHEYIATLEGHKERVFSLEPLWNRRLASGCDDGIIKIWDTIKNVCLKTFVAHKYSVTCMKSLTASTIVSGSYQDIKIWNVDNGRCVKTFLGHTDWVRSLIRFNDITLVSCSEDKTIKMWYLDTGACFKTIYQSNEVYCVILLPNGQLASGSRDRLINIWDIESYKCIATLRGHSMSVWRLQLLESGELVSCSTDESIKIWDLNRFTCICTLIGHIGPVRAIKVGPNKMLISCSDDGTIKVWNLNTLECVKDITGHNGMHIRDLALI